MYLVHLDSQGVKILLLKSANAATSLLVSRELEYYGLDLKYPSPTGWCFKYLGLSWRLYCKMFGNFRKKFGA